MLIEQIIEFEWRGLGLLDRTCTLITGNFHIKTKIFEKNLRLDYFLQVKYLQKLTPKAKS